jgi:hypothetical protein
MELRVQLKICEACGCLWYRAQADNRVYCSTCELKFKDFPTALSRKRRGRPRKTVLPAVFAVEVPPEPEWEIYPAYLASSFPSVADLGGAK